MALDDNITYGDKYGPAMQMTDPKEAAAYFEVLVEHCMRFVRSREEAERIEKSNLGYYAGYYDAATRGRVERLFACAHPVFGAIAERGAPSPEEAFEAGKRMASGQ